MVLHTRGRVGRRHFQESLSSEKNTDSLFFVSVCVIYRAAVRLELGVGGEEKEIGEDVEEPHR